MADANDRPGHTSAAAAPPAAAKDGIDAGERARARRGLRDGIAAYALWGLLPVYWKLLGGIPALELIGHRVVWSCVALALVVALRPAGSAAPPLTRAVVAATAAAALLIGVNWLTYVWAVQAGHIVEVSLGYFVNPLLSVVLGVVVFRERLRRLQWTAVALAAAGVLVLTALHERVPWIALTLASTFALYGLAKKRAPLGPVRGLLLETAILLPAAAGWLLHEERAGRAALGHAGAGTSLLLLAAGPVTTVPLLLFASAAQRIPLSLVGMLQYLAPTLQLLLGVLVYGEAFPVAKAGGFALVWAALALYAWDGWRAVRVTRLTR